jgi:hypothetical protein
MRAALHEVNREQCSPPLEELEVARIAHSVARYDPATSNKAPLDVVSMETVSPEQVDWLWYPYIPLGKITVAEGDPGLGKTTCALAIATAVSLGRGLPNAPTVDPRTVLLLSAEDGLADTIRPRLDAMGADCARIKAVRTPFTFDSDGLDRLRPVITRYQPALVIIDPLVAYIGANVDMHRANETREVMAALAEIANHSGCAILLIRHLTKGSREKSIYRGIGSIDITAAARSVLLIGADAHDRTKRAVVQVKCNLAPMGPAVGYTLDDGQFLWTGVSDLTAQRILADESDSDGATQAEAERFLLEALQGGPQSSSHIQRDARAQGISDRTLQRARRALGVKADAQRRDGKVVSWRLRLPIPIQEPLLNDVREVNNADEY